MYFDDHNPPHFHAHNRDFKLLISINDFASLDGNYQQNIMIGSKMSSFISK